MDHWKPQIFNKDKLYPFLIVDDWYSKQEEKNVWKELEFYTSNESELYRAETSWVAKDKDKPKGFSYRIYPDLYYVGKHRNVSNIFKYLYKQQQKEFHKLIKEAMPHGRQFQCTNGTSSLISYYDYNDYYDSHFDVFNFTCLIWFNKTPKLYTGGDFYFPESDTTIESKHNRMCIFPSYYLHQVKPIIFNNKPKELGYGRYTITHFYYTYPEPV